MITAERIQLFRSYFGGLAHVYGTYDPATGRAWQVKEPVTDQAIRDHLKRRSQHYSRHEGRGLNTRRQTLITHWHRSIIGSASGR
jgi:hypothetical protein